MVSRLFTASFLLLALAACESLSYYHQAVSGHLALLYRAQSIDAIRKNADPALAQKLALVQQMREFASSQLGLPVGRAYSRYVEIDGEYVVWNVFATGEFSVAPEQWCFPVAGCVSYRGYFRQEDAQHKAARLAARGLDTYIGGASAYSTLGWSADPVLSSFLSRGELSLAALLFHELSHRQLYLRDDTQFNESFATAVELYAVRQWIVFRQDDAARDTLSAQWQQMEARRDARRQFTEAVAAAREDLEALYSSPLNEKAMREAKARRLSELGAKIRALGEGRPWAAAYASWSSGLNNARLVPVALYSKWEPAFSLQLQQALASAGCTGQQGTPGSQHCRQGLASFYRLARELAGSSKAARQRTLEKWATLARDEIGPPATRGAN